MIESDGNVYVFIDHFGKDEFIVGYLYKNTFDKIWSLDQK